MRTAKRESGSSRAAVTLTDALLTRTRRAVAEVTTGVDERTAADAVSASSDALVLVRLLEQPEILESLRTADPLAPARLRGIEARQKLIDRAGGVLASEEVAASLGLTRQAIEKRRRSGRLLALSLGKRGYRYPAFQFIDGKVLPGLDRVLDALRGRDDWTQLSFFVNRRGDLGNQTPVKSLRAGKVGAVVDAAGAEADQGAG